MKTAVHSNVLLKAETGLLSLELSRNSYPWLLGTAWRGCGVLLSSLVCAQNKGRGGLWDQGMVSVCREVCWKNEQPKEKCGQR